MEETGKGLLVLLRHGESSFNEEGLFSGWSDCPLTAEGVRQAHEAGRTLREAGIAFDACFTSVLSRAVETAKIVFAELGESDTPVERTWKLNERHYGSLEGTSKAVAVAQYGAPQVGAWRNGIDDLPPPVSADDRRHPRFNALYRDVPADQLPGTECLRDAFRRVIVYYEEEIRPLLESGKNVLVVAHGNPVRALVAHIEGRPADFVPLIGIGNAAPIIFRPHVAPSAP